MTGPSTRRATRRTDRPARPHTVAHEVELPDGRVELDVTVAGDRRLDYLLVTLDPDVEIVSPPEARDRRRAVARELLAQY